MNLWLSVNGAIMQDIFEFLSVVNRDFSGTLSFLVAFLLLIVTTIYVLQTKKQVEATLLAVRKSSLPQLVVEYDSGHLSEVFNEHGRRQLSLNCSITNYGQDPALSIYCFGEARLQNGTDSNKTVAASHDSELIAGLKGGGETSFSIVFETAEIEAILNDLSITYKKNIQRLQKGGHEEPFSGVVIAVMVVYANCFNELSFSETLVELSWFNPDNLNDLEKSPNRNKYTVPPNQLKNDLGYTPMTINPRFTPARYGSITEEELKLLLTKRSDQLTRVCARELNIKGPKDKTIR